MRIISYSLFAVLPSDAGGYVLRHSVYCRGYGNAEQTDQYESLALEELTELLTSLAHTYRPGTAIGEGFLQPPLELLED